LSAHGIPFVTIADRIEMTVDVKGKRINGPALVLKQWELNDPDHCC
jgi:hypothetical protein